LNNSKEEKYVNVVNDAPNLPLCAEVSAIEEPDAGKLQTGVCTEGAG